MTYLDGDMEGPSMPGTPALDLLESSISDTIARLDRAVSRVEHDPGNIHDEIHLCRETLAARELLDHIGGLIRKERRVI
jgi:hypothetical protein